MKLLIMDTMGDQIGYVDEDFTLCLDEEVDEVGGLERYVDVGSSLKRKVDVDVELDDNDLTPPEAKEEAGRGAKFRRIKSLVNYNSQYYAELRD